MPRLLLLLPISTYRAEAFLEAARKLRVEVILGLERTAVLPDRPQHAWLSLNFSEPARSIDAVLDYARKHQIHAVLGVDDNTAVLAAQIAEALGLPHNSVESVSAARNKHRMRELLREHGVRVPAFTRYSIFDPPEMLAGQVSYPCVLKPLVLSASCGVIRANDRKEFTEAFQRIVALLTSLGVAGSSEAGRQILVEDFIPGREVALEGLLIGGSLHVLALFDKPDPLDGPFFEETIYITPSRLPDPIQQEIASCAARAAEALGLREGPIHAELRINDQGVWIIEVAARSIGGRCSQTLRFASDLSLEELILLHALRMALPPFERRAEASGVMMIPIPKAGVLKEVRGHDHARDVPGIEAVCITAELGQRVVPLPEGTRYLGFLIARGAGPEAVEAALRDAHERLEFVIEADREDQKERTGEDHPLEGRSCFRF